MNIGIDHGYYAIKTRHCSFPAGLTAYGSHEPYTRQGLLEFGGCFFVCGTGRQPIQRDKTINDNYYLLTLTALAQEIRSRGAPTECTVRIAAGLPLTSYGRDKPKFRSYLLRPSQPVQFRYEGVEYSITIADVQLFPQGFAALMAEPDLLTDEPSLLLMDIGGWTVDLMRIDNALPVAETAHTVQRWQQTDGVQGYHLVQSFAEGEVTPELAHRIGVELAEQLLQGRFQAVVTTHLNTKHYHNHIVWCSVAMDNGRKYHSNAKS